MQQSERGRFARARRADERHRFAGQRREAQIGHRGPLAVVGKRHVLEFHEAVYAPGIHGIGAVAYRRLRIEHLEKFGEPRGVHDHPVGEVHGLFEPADQQRGKAHEHDDLADRGEIAQV